MAAAAPKYTTKQLLDLAKDVIKVVEGLELIEPESTGAAMLFKTNKMFEIRRLNSLIITIEKPDSIDAYTEAEKKATVETSKKDLYRDIQELVTGKTLSTKLLFFGQKESPAAYLGKILNKQIPEVAPTADEASPE